MFLMSTISSDMGLVLTIGDGGVLDALFESVARAGRDSIAGEREKQPLVPCTHIYISRSA